MPMYDFVCDNCSFEFEELTPLETRDRVACPECGGTTTVIWRNVPWAHGLSDGPGSCVNECVFNRPDIEKETRIALKGMEDAGKLDTPEKRHQAEVLMESAKNYRGPKLDYEKGGHPLD